MIVDDEVAKLATQLSPVSDGTRWYVFGSGSDAVRAASDYDLLIVYPTRDLDRARQLLARIAEWDVHQELDLVVLDEAEERQVGFVAAEKARLIWPETTLD